MPVTVFRPKIALLIARRNPQEYLLCWANLGWDTLIDQLERFAVCENNNVIVSIITTPFK